MGEKKLINNKQVYQMYKGKMCMRHSIEIFTPIIDQKLGYEVFTGQMDNSEVHSKSMSEINEKIAEVLGDNLEVDIGKIETTILFGEPLKL
jgi:hypothetical protein